MNGFVSSEYTEPAGICYLPGLDSLLFTLSSGTFHLLTGLSSDPCFPSPTAPGGGADAMSGSVSKELLKDPRQVEDEGIRVESCVGDAASGACWFVYT